MKWILVLIAAICIALFSNIGGRVASPNPPSVQLNQEKLWSLVQDWRQSQRLPEYEENQQLCDIANARLKEIQTDYSHNGIIRRFPNNKHWDYPFSKIGENLVQYSHSPEEALSGWVNSPEHLKNLKDDFKYSCLETEGSYAVQLFANPEVNQVTNQKSKVCIPGPYIDGSVLQPMICN